MLWLLYTPLHNLCPEAAPTLMWNFTAYNQIWVERGILCCVGCELYSNLLLINGIRATSVF